MRCLARFYKTLSSTPREPRHKDSRTSKPAMRPPYAKRVRMVPVSFSKCISPPDGANRSLLRRLAPQIDLPVGLLRTSNNGSPYPLGVCLYQATHRVQHHTHTLTTMPMYHICYRRHGTNAPPVGKKDGRHLHHQQQL